MGIGPLLIASGVNEQHGPFVRVRIVRASPGAFERSAGWECKSSVESKLTRRDAHGTAHYFRSGKRPLKGRSVICLCVSHGSVIKNAELPQRSEERRVGKECRTRWSPDHS